MKLKAFIAVLVVWALGMTWMAMGKPGATLDSFGTETVSENLDSKPVFPETTEVLGVIDALYSFQSSEGVDVAVNRVNGIFSEDLKRQRIGDFKRDLEVLLKRGHDKTVEVRLVSVDTETLKTTAEIKVNQGRRGSVPEFRPQSLIVSLQFYRARNGELKISGLSEEMPEPGLLGAENAKNVSLQPGFQANLNFPCPIKSVVPIGKSSEVEYQVSGARGELRLIAPAIVVDEEKFRVKCKKIYFDLTVGTEGTQRILFSLIEKATGNNFKKKLTKKQLIFKALEEQTGLKMIE